MFQFVKAETLIIINFIVSHFSFSNSLPEFQHVVKLLQISKPPALCLWIQWFDGPIVNSHCLGYMRRF